MSRWLQGSEGRLTCLSPAHLSNCPCASVQLGCRDVRSRLTRMEKMLDMMQMGEFKLEEVTRKVRVHCRQLASLHAGMLSCSTG